MVVDTEMDPNEAAALFVTAQLARFIVCSVAVVLPCVLLIATLPMKTTSRWKLPLRVACACVSVLMLSFNISSWWVEFQAFENEEKPADLSWFGYIVIASSIGLLLLMAVLFIVFVVFRGAQLQKKIEDADEEEESIKDLVVQIRLYLDERREQRVFTAWRVVAVDMIADRARILQLAAEQAEADAITAEAARVEALERAAAVVVGELTLPDDDGRRLIEQQHDGGEGGDGGEEVRDVHALTGDHDVVPTALPDDWIPSLDIGTGEVTYLNPETDERLTEENALPDGWIASLDISTGEVVYLNLETDERLTEEPHELNGGWVLTSSLLDDAGSTAEGDDGGEVTKKPRKLYTNTITGKTSNKRPLPLQPGWSVTLDPDTGRPFYRHETDGTSSFAAPLILPGGWVKLCEEESGHPYYYNKVTGATSWGHPHELPASSSSNEELQEGMVFELDALPPLDVVEDVFDFDQVCCCFQGLATRSRPFLSHGCLTHPPSLPPSLSQFGPPPPIHPTCGPSSSSSSSECPSSSSSSSSGSNSSSEDEEGGGGGDNTHVIASPTHAELLASLELSTRPKKSKKKKRKVRWAWTPRTGRTLAECLFNRTIDDTRKGSGGTTSLAIPIPPPHLQELFDKLFTMADVSRDGELDTLELMKLFRKRAKDTPLEGDMHAIFSLKSLIAKEGGDKTGEHGAITAAVFARGMMKAVTKKPNGHVAQVRSCFHELATLSHLPPRSVTKSYD